LESLYPLPHGKAVEQGLLFSLNWSFHKGFLNKKYFEEMKKLIPQQQVLKKISLILFKKNLRQDKKYTKSHNIDFIFIKKPGHVFIQSVSEKALYNEAKRQGVI